MAEMRYCSKCRKTIADTNFYTLKGGVKSDLCKACETLHINNYDPDTFLWLLEKYDVPWLPWEWNHIADKQYQKDPYKFNGMSVFGRYLSKMKLKNYKDFHWADSDRLQTEHEEKAKLYGTPEEQMKEKIEQMREAYENGEITEAQWLTYKEINEPRKPEFETVDGAITTAGPGGNPYPVNDNPFEKIDLPDISEQLTVEDKIYLATKWGRLYTAADWVTLEKMYKDYESSFDLHNADLIAGTIQLCKLDLKGNQALDSGDIENYSRIARASDALRKSLKFTEAQRKEDKTGEFTSYGQIVAYAEMKQGGIPKISLDVDRDIVDRDIRDIKNYNKSLVEEDPAIFKMIEQYIKKRENLLQQEKDLEEARENGDDFVSLSDEDLAEYNNSLNSNNNEEEEE